MKITKGKQAKPQKVVIYGAEGIGKTTLASNFPDPVFIDTEGGTSHLDVMRTDKPSNWGILLGYVAELAKADYCKTIVIDTADWAEQLCVDHICTTYKKKGVEDFGYGKGYTYLAEEFSQFLRLLDEAIANGKHVVLNAHAKMRKFEQPDEMGAYDRWELKLSKQVAPLVKEWADLLLFCNYQTTVVTTDDGKHKAQGGKRVIYTSHSPVWDAKNRCGLPECVPMEYQAIKQAIEPTNYIEQLRNQMQADNITETQLMDAIHSRGQHTEVTTLEALPQDFITAWVIKYYNNLIQIIKGE